MMEPSQPDRVRVDVAGELVDITWHERDLLLEELSFVRGCMDIRQAFEAVGAIRTVELDDTQRSRLSAALEDWGEHGDQRPEGLTRLLMALERPAE
jgi:hypothetical protein